MLLQNSTKAIPENLFVRIKKYDLCHESTLESEDDATI
jgi:hypothetical protein